MDKTFLIKILESSLKAISYIMIVLALISWGMNIIKFRAEGSLRVYTIVMLLMEVGAILSFLYSYYLFYKKNKHATLFILLPLTIFFLYLTYITSYSFSIASYGTLGCIIMLFTVEIESKLKLILISISSTIFIIIFILQNFGVIPVEVLDTTMSLIDRLVLLFVMLIFFAFIGLSLYIYHVNSLSMGSIEKLLKQYEEVLSFAKDKYNYTDRETEVARFLIQGLSNTEIADKLDIANNTVKAHVKHVLDKAGIESRATYYSTLVDRYIPF